MEAGRLLHFHVAVDLMVFLVVVHLISEEVEWRLSIEFWLPAVAGVKDIAMVQEVLGVA
jgi:hypothetical protein